MVRTASIEWRILVVAPFGTDAINTVQMLEKAGHSAQAFRTLSSAVEAAQAGCGMLLMTEESLDARQHEVLAAWLAAQPKWSNLPVVLIVLEPSTVPSAASHRNSTNSPAPNPRSVSCADCPPIRLPAGAAITVVTPADRVIGMATAPASKPSRAW